MKLGGNFFNDFPLMSSSKRSAFAGNDTYCSNSLDVMGRMFNTIDQLLGLTQLDYSIAADPFGCGSVGSGKRQYDFEGAALAHFGFHVDATVMHFHNFESNR